MGDKRIPVSVIVPVYNAVEYLERTLPAIRKSDYPHFELIVVDDNSSDSSAEFAEKYADVVLRTGLNAGQGKARNVGARASKGAILFFVDHDVQVFPDTISLVVETMEENPGIAALFGSYDADPPSKDFFSQYENLSHHFVHQNSNPEARTFWSGCGAVRREIFFESGGYSAPLIEDVELGYRLTESGKNIMLLKKLQVKHLKKWSFLSLLKTDIFCRAVPWTRLAYEKGLPRDLNFSISDRISGVIACLIPLSLVLMWRWGQMALLFAGLAGGFIYLNRRILAFFLKKRGIKFTVFAAFYHWLYFLYSSVTFLLLSVIYYTRSKMRGSPQVR